LITIGRLIGIILLVLAISALVLARYEKGHIQEEGSKAFERIGEGESILKGSPMGAAFGSILGGSLRGKASGEIEKYQKRVKWLTIGGITIGVIGLAMTIFCRKKNINPLGK
jgi:hypothetical protein